MYKPELINLPQTQPHQYDFQWWDFVTGKFPPYSLLTYSHHHDDDNDDNDDDHDGCLWVRIAQPANCQEAP